MGKVYASRLPSVFNHYYCHFPQEFVIHQLFVFCIFIFFLNVLHSHLCFHLLNFLFSQYLRQLSISTLKGGRSDIGGQPGLCYETLFFFVFVIVFFQMVSFVCLFCFAYPGTHSVCQAGLELSSTCLPNAGNKGMNQLMSDFDPIFKTK